MIIKKVHEAGKQVIIATQMLDSMMKNLRPIRAETTDVANAIYDGTSAIILLGETTAGLYPVESLQTMVKIVQSTEEDIDYIKRFNHQVITALRTIGNAICTTAHDIKVKLIITVTKSGQTARMISKYRPACMIMGCSPEAQVVR